MLNGDYRFGITSQQITMRINELFQGKRPHQWIRRHRHGPEGPGRSGPRAAAVSAQCAALPARGSPDPASAAQKVGCAAGQGRRTANPPPKLEVKEATGRPYFQRLADDLLDPARTVVAALRLEALGTASISVLQEGLKSKDALVRFCSAEALAYLGSPSSGEELGQAVAGQPMLARLRSDSPRLA